MTVKQIKDMGKSGDVGALMLAYKAAKRTAADPRTSMTSCIAASRIVDAARVELERRGYHDWLTATR